MYASLKDHDVPLVENGQLTAAAEGLVAQIVGGIGSWLDGDKQVQIPPEQLVPGRIRAIIYPEGSTEADYLLDDPNIPANV
jgi:hypothetical protein